MNFLFTVTFLEETINAGVTTGYSMNIITRKQVMRNEEADRLLPDVASKCVDKIKIREEFLVVDECSIKFYDSQKDNRL